MSDLTSGPLDPNMRTLFVSCMKWSCKSLRRDLNVFKEQKKIITFQENKGRFFRNTFMIFGTCDNLMSIASELEMGGSIGIPTDRRRKWRRKYIEANRK